MSRAFASDSWLLGGDVAKRKAKSNVPAQRARGSSLARSKTTLGTVVDAIMEELASSVPGGKLVYKLARTLAKHGGRVLEDNLRDALAAAAEEAAKQEAAEKELLVETLELSRRQTTLALRAILEAGRHPDLELRQALGRFFVRVQQTDPEKVRAFEIADALSRITAPEYAVLRILVRYAREGRTIFRKREEVITSGDPPGRASLEFLRQENAELRDYSDERMFDIDERLFSLGLVRYPSDFVPAPAPSMRIRTVRMATALGLSLVDMAHG